MKISEQQIKKITPYLLSLIGIFYLIVYFPLLKNDPFLQRDDLRIVSPLEAVSDFAGYVEAVKTDLIPDVQPIRDLSYFANIKVFALTGLKTFHLTNLLLLTVCIFLFMKILTHLKFSPKAVLFGTLLFAFHPILVSGFGWISSRKHVLGLLFIFLAIDQILKKEKLNLVSVLSYLAAICSHQIFIFFPAWVLVYFKGYKIKLDKRLYAVMIIGGVIVFSIGFFKTFYIGTGDDSYALYSLSEHISRSVLSAGRAATLIMSPVVIAAVYGQGSFYNLIGIALFIIYFFLIYKSKTSKDSFIWVTLAVLTFGPSLIAFVNDTYLYLPLATFIISTLFLVRDHINKFAPVALLIVILFAIKTVTASKMWRSDLDLWQYSYEQEHAPYSSMQLGNVLLKHDKKLALEYLIAGAKDFDLISHHPLMTTFAFAIFNSDLPFDKKLSIFEECYVEHEIYKGIYALTLIQGGTQHQVKGLEILKSIIVPGRNFEAGSTGDRLVSNIRETCSRFADRSYICQELRINY